MNGSISSAKRPTSRSNKKIIVITMGDPQGIGPEVISKALHTEYLHAKARFIVVGDKKVLGRIHPLVEVLGLKYRSSGEGSLKFLDKAIELIKTKHADAIVTGPLSKEKVSRYYHHFRGHTEYLAQAFGVKNFDMMFVADKIRLTIVTRHVPLKEVPPMITSRSVFNSVVLMAETLKAKFKIKDPKIAVLGLNPHAGELGLLGYEEIKSIGPAIQKARLFGINANGPLPADTFFAFSQNKDPYDGIVAMYHDQGLAPIKGLYMKELVNFTAGLPFVRTSPSHGTAFDIAGKNTADPSSMFCALKLACQLA